MTLYTMKNSVEAPQNRSEARMTGLKSVIDAIVQIANYETEEMKHNRPFDIATVNMRKARLLFDFNVASKDIQASDLTEDMILQLKNMQLALRRSVRQYQSHASAVREIADLIIHADQARTSDGTYGLRISS